MRSQAFCKGKDTINNIKSSITDNKRFKSRGKISICNKSWKKTKRRKKLKMTHGYCVKCKEKVEMKDPKETKTKRGTMMAKGKCPKCGTTVCCMLGKKK